MVMCPTDFFYGCNISAPFPSAIIHQLCFSVVCILQCDSSLFGSKRSSVSSCPRPILCTLCTFTSLSKIIFKSNLNPTCVGPSSGHLLSWQCKTNETDFCRMYFDENLDRSANNFDNNNFVSRLNIKHSLMMR